MKIVDLRVRTVAIPTQGMLRHNTGVHPGYLMRTVLELITDQGIVGLGEVGGGDQRAALTKLKPRIVGMDPFDLEAIKLKVLRSIYYLSNSRLYGAIEIACLDIQGKAAGVPMHALLGGKVRDAVPLIAYLFWRYDRPGGGDDTRAEDMADLCVELKETLGVRAMKLKAGVLEPMEEARVLKLCRQRLGDDFGLRIDGFSSDNQRSFYVLKKGETRPPEEVQQAFEAVQAAIRAAVKAAAPGVYTTVPRDKANEVFTSRGYPPVGGLGHEMGTFAHEGGMKIGRDFANPELDYHLEEGMVFTMEPAILTSHGRLCQEEDVVITRTGCRILSFPQEEVWLVR